MTDLIMRKEETALPLDIAGIGGGNTFGNVKANLKALEGV
jgi:hypothetical protein